MTRLSLLSRSLSASVLLCAAAIAVPLVHALQDEGFREQFEKHAKAGETEQAAALVKEHVDETIVWVVEVAEAISAAPSDELFERIGRLRAAWKTAVQTSFVDEMEKYFSLLDPKIKSQRTRLRKEYDAVMARYEKASSPPVSEAELAALSLELEGMAKTFEDFQDRYFASQAWYHVGRCTDAALRKDGADLHRACKAFGRAIELREAIDLKDSVYETIKPRFDQLKAQGFTNPPGAAPTPPPAAEKAVANASAVTAPLAFAVAADLGAVERPCYFLDELYPMWNSIGLLAKGSKSEFPRLPDAPELLRLGANQVMIDLDRDGQGDVEVPLTGNIEPVEIGLGKGEEARRWAFLSVVGVQKDTYQGIEMNLAPDDNQLPIFTAPGASMVGTIGETAVRVFDDNMDGVYGSPAMTYGYVGCTPGVFAPEMDAIQVGEEKRARPWSEILEIGGAWYRLQAEKGGTSVSATPADVETGLLKLKFKGPAPTWLVVKGDGEFANSYYDIAGAGPKGAVVPAGRYTLYYGEVREGKKKQTLKALILPGLGTPEWNVPAGGEAVAELGGPFGFDFRFEATETSIKVLGNTVAVIGARGERYERPWGCVPKPEVSYRVKGSRKASKPEKMGLVQHQDDISELGWAAAWFPRDLEIPKEADEAEVEVQLTEKSHKLFGKIESEWKE